MRTTLGTVCLGLGLILAACGGSADAAKPIEAPATPTVAAPAATDTPATPTAAKPADPTTAKTAETAAKPAPKK